MRRRALVTGSSGQDGWYLIQLLVSKDYEVHAHSREASAIVGVAASYSGDLSNHSLVSDIVNAAVPDEIYNLCSLSRPQQSWDLPLQAGLLNALMPHQLFELVRKSFPSCRIFQATSSEIFGDAMECPQSESTVPMPQTPYGIAKLYAHQMAGAYRHHYNMFICSGILFNHESPGRPLSFVSQKIVHAAACISLGIRTTRETDDRGIPIVRDGILSLGNIDVSRDFGFAGDYVEAMWLMLQQDPPRDYVIGTGESHTIREFCQRAFAAVGLDWRDHVAIDPGLVRPVDSRHTVADTARAREELGWSARMSFEALIEHMVESRVRDIKGKLDASADR